MELNIRLFATLKDRAGRSQILVSLDEPATVQTVLETIVSQYPALATAVASSIVSVNKAFAGADTAVRPGDEVAIFPPVSGGDMPHPTYFTITTAEVDINAIHQHLTTPDVGAIVSFAGSVRGQTNRQGLPDATTYLEYEAYEEMAEQKMAQIAQEIWERWPLVKGIAIVQRIGALQVGDMTTFVACAAAHRDQGAFDAARYGIDRLKEIVPVWKKEVGPDKSVWVEGHYHPTEQDNKSP
ncbi:MAG TPA: molybdenum cofactor biosynthesis protein MoaE [Chloroflexota bacterium]|nr:molybdenum cofactor biosynthesis protein MoaE [Chloroflexota bacterium]